MSRRLPPRAVIFDLNGVLTRPPLASSWRRLLTIAEADHAALHDAYWRYRPTYDRGGSTARDYWRQVGEAVGRAYPDARVVRLVRADAALWGRANQPVVREFLRLQAAGVRTAILSNTPRDVWEQLARKHGWFASADVRTLSFEVGEVKPEPRIYLQCLRDLGVAPSEAWFVDDRVDFVDGAQRLGVTALHYTSSRALAAWVERALA